MPIRDAIGRPLFGMSLFVAFVVMALPSSTLSRMRHACRPLGLAMDWLEQRATYFDMDHIVFFAMLAFAWVLLVPGMRQWRRSLYLSLALAMATELMQFMVPGRIPRISDVRDDLLGTVAGWLLASSLLWLARWGARQWNDRNPAVVP